MVDESEVEPVVLANKAALSELQCRRSAETVPIAFARQFIAAGESITGKAVEVRFVPLSEEHGNSFVISKDQLIGRIALNEMRAGQLIDLSDLEPAESFYLRLVHNAEQALGYRSLEVARLLHLLADSYWSSPRLVLPFDFENYVKAVELYRRALEIHEEACGEYSQEVFKDCLAVARMFSRLEKYSEVEKYLNRALEIYRVLERSIPPEELDFSSVIVRLAGHYESTGESALAEQYLRELVSVKERALCQSTLELTLRLGGLADFYFEQGNFVESEKLHQRILSYYERAFGRDNTQFVHSLRAYSKFLREIGRGQDAEVLLAEAAMTDVASDPSDN